LKKYLAQLERQKEDSFEQFITFEASTGKRMRPQLISESKLIEIRSFTATELFKTRSKTNRLFDEF
jgi:hypothetical protein